MPCSVKLSKTIKATYETSIQETIDNANNIQKKIKKDKENKNFFGKAAEAFFQQHKNIRRRLTSH